jgi:hypothetical protein
LDEFYVGQLPLATGNDYRLRIWMFLTGKSSPLPEKMRTLRLPLRETERSTWLRANFPAKRKLFYTAIPIFMLL